MKCTVLTLRVVIDSSDSVHVHPHYSRGVIDISKMIVNWTCWNFRTVMVRRSGLKVIKLFFMLNSAEHEICPHNKSQITNNSKFFLAKYS